jgi:hypothetical protein
MCSSLQLKVLARMKVQPSFSAANIPFTTVVTDLTRCHRTWFHRVRISVDLTLLYTINTLTHTFPCHSKWTSALLPHS